VRLHYRLQSRSTALARFYAVTFLPKLLSNAERVNFDFLPPRDFVCALVQSAMMGAAERNRELIADLPSHGAWLCETQMVCIGRTSTTHQAGLRSDECPMVFVSLAPDLAKG
jgi:hypothetical protein